MTGIVGVAEGCRTGIGALTGYRRSDACPIAIAIVSHAAEFGLGRVRTGLVKQLCLLAQSDIAVRRLRDRRRPAAQNLRVEPVVSVVRPVARISDRIGEPGHSAVAVVHLTEVAAGSTHRSSAIVGVQRIADSLP